MNSHTVQNLLQGGKHAFQAISGNAYTSQRFLSDNFRHRGREYKPPRCKRWGAARWVRQCEGRRPTLVMGGWRFCQASKTEINARPDNAQYVSDRPPLDPWGHTFPKGD